MCVVHKRFDPKYAYVSLCGVRGTKFTNDNSKVTCKRCKDAIAGRGIYKRKK